MSKFFVNSNQILNDKIIIEGSDYNHIKNVLRSKIDDELIVCDSQNSINYNCKIIGFGTNTVECEILFKFQDDVESNIKITVFQGLPKADKMELIIQKGVELGVTTFVPVSLKRSIVKLNGKDEEKKIVRWNTIAEVASKQSGRSYIPQVENVLSFKLLLDRIKDYDLIFLAYEEEKDLTLKELLKEFKEQNIDKINNKQDLNIAFIIGPEGGMAKEEVQELKEKGVKTITLGSRILRTETASLNITSIIMYELN
jgi:16S rRNA (uracil1498-N3)-methyltransferase